MFASGVQHLPMQEDMGQGSESSHVGLRLSILLNLDIGFHHDRQQRKHMIPLPLTMASMR